MVSEDELFQRVERLKLRLSTSGDQEEREILARLIWALLDLAEAAYPVEAVAERRYA